MVQSKGPYYLSGYSLGLHLALEMAQQLFARGETVAFLGIIDDQADLTRRYVGADRYKGDGMTVEESIRLALKRYIPKMYPGRITLFRATEQFIKHQHDPDMGWGNLALCGVDINEVSGDHHSVVAESGIQHLMPVFNRCCLKKARLWAETNPSLPYFAETQYRLAKQRQAQGIVKYHTLARSNAKQGDVDAEIAAYQQAIASAEAIPYWIYQNLAEAFFNRNQLPEAIAYYRKVVETAPDYILAYVKLGDYSTDTGERKEALNYYQMAEEKYAQALGRQPDDLELIIKYGHCLLKQGKIPSAMDKFSQVLQIDPKNLKANQLLADCLMKQQRTAEATACFELLLKYYPDNPQIHIKTGMLYLHLEEPLNAVQSSRNAIDKDPYFIRGYQLLVNQLLRLQRFSEASAVCHKSLELMPENQLINALCREAGVQRENIKC